MSSEYFTKSDMNNIYGETNVNRWADAAGVAATITTRVEAAIDYASDHIDGELRNSPYLIPIVNSAGSTPSAIVDIGAKLGGMWLRESKGLEDGHILLSVKGEANLALANIRLGKVLVGAL